MAEGEKLRKFQGDVTLVLIGLFLALAVQNVIQFFQSLFGKINPYFYLINSVLSVVMVLTLLSRAAGYAGVSNPRDDHRKLTISYPRSCDLSIKELKVQVEKNCPYFSYSHRYSFA